MDAEPSIIHVDRDALNAGTFVEVPADSPKAVAQAGAGKIGVAEWAVIVDNDTATELPDGQIGEVWISGQNMGTGYWGKPEETVETFQNTLKSRTNPSHAQGATDDATSEQLVIVGERAPGAHRLGMGPIADDIRAAIAVRHGVTVRDVLLTSAGAIPRTSSGKIGRRACRAAYLDGSLRSGKVANDFPD